MNDRVLRFPYRGAPQTVEVIKAAALQSQNDMNVRALAESVCEKLRAKDYLSEILAIANFVEANTRYMRDPRTVELVRSPNIVARQLMSGTIPQLDCDDMVALLTGLFLSIGCSVRIVVVAFRNAFYKGQRQYSHVFVEALEPRSGAWIAVDPVAGPNTAAMLKRGKAFKYWNVA